MITTGATNITACGKPRLSSCWLRAVAVGTCTELAPLPPLGRSTPTSTAIPARSLRVLLAETRRIRTFETSVFMDAAIASRKPSLTVSENSATVIGRPSHLHHKQCVRGYGRARELGDNRTIRAAEAVVTNAASVFPSAPPIVTASRRGIALALTVARVRILVACLAVGSTVPFGAVLGNLHAAVISRKPWIANTAPVPRHLPLLEHVTLAMQLL